MWALRAATRGYSFKTEREGLSFSFHKTRASSVFFRFSLLFSLFSFSNSHLYYIPYLADNCWSGGYFVNIILTWRHDIAYPYLHWAFRLISTVSLHQFLEKFNVSLVVSRVLRALAVLAQTIAKAQPSRSSINGHCLTLKSQLSALCRLPFRTTAEQEGSLTPWVARICP